MDLRQGAQLMGLELNDRQLGAFDRYRAELVAWNQRFNLTGVSEPALIDTTHFLDSLSCLAVLPAFDQRPLSAWLESAPMAVDVGAGAGFPGLPLKIVWPRLRLTLVEATGKKVNFLHHIIEQLQLEDVAVVNARAEDFGQGKGRERFDLALARALAPLPTTLELTLPLLRVGGWLIAQKGRHPGEELVASRVALQTLGGSYHDAVPVVVPGLDAQRTLVIIAKAGRTPQAYPRRAGTPKKQPLL